MQLTTISVFLLFHLSKVLAEQIIVGVRSRFSQLFPTPN